MRMNERVHFQLNYLTIFFLKQFCIPITKLETKQKQKQNKNKTKQNKTKQKQNKTKQNKMQKESCFAGHRKYVNYDLLILHCISSQVLCFQISNC